MNDLNVAKAISEKFSKMSEKEIFEYLDSIGLKYEKLPKHNETHSTVSSGIRGVSIRRYPMAAKKVAKTSLQKRAFKRNHQKLLKKTIG